MIFLIVCLFVTLISRLCYVSYTRSHFPTEFSSGRSDSNVPSQIIPRSAQTHSVLDLFIFTQWYSLVIVLRLMCSSLCLLMCVSDRLSDSYEDSDWISILLFDKSFEGVKVTGRISPWKYCLSMLMPNWSDLEKYTEGAIDEEWKQYTIHWEKKYTPGTRQFNSAQFQCHVKQNSVDILCRFAYFPSEVDDLFFE